MLSDADRQRIREEEEERIRVRRELSEPPPAKPRPQGAGTSCLQGCGIVGAGIVVLLFLIAVTSPHSNTDYSSPPPAAQSPSSASHYTASGSPEAQLASLELGVAVTESDPKTREFSELLDTIGKKAPSGTRQGNANVIVLTQKELREAGISNTLREVLYELIDSMPEKGEPYQLPQVAGLYLTLRKSGGR